MDVLIELLPLIVVGAVAAGQALTRSSRFRRVNPGWADAARTLGLRLKRASLTTKPRLWGRIEDCFVTVELRGGTLPSQKIFTRFRVSYPRSLGLGLRLLKQDPIMRLAQRRGYAQDIQVGDPAFDDAVAVRGADAARVVEFLTPDRRQRIRRFFESCPDAAIQDQVVRLQKRSRVTRSETVVATVRALAEIAQSLFPGPPVEARGVAVSPEPVLEPAPAPTPAPPPREPAPSTDPPDAPVEPDVSVDSTVTDVRSFCAALFEAADSTFDAERLFDERYRGDTVRWPGVLLRAENYHFDPVFGHEPGTRAHVEVFDFTSQFGSKQHVVAFVQLLEVAVRDLEPAIGTAVTVRGTLAKVDRLMRRIYLADGAIDV